MRKPDESLGDFTVPTTEFVSEPPRQVQLQATGEFEFLQPLNRSTGVRSRLRQPLWFRRVLTVGSVAIVMMAAAIVSAILIDLTDRVSRGELATNFETGDTLSAPKELYTFDLSYPVTVMTAPVSRTSPRRRPIRRVYVDRAERQAAPVMQIPQPKFIPTTLVIYAENGVIKSRIEPWL
jgi:hypothetical protein